MAERVLGVASLLLASAAHAHPGHAGASAASWLHGLEPAHLVPALLACAAFALAARAAGKRAASRERRR